MYGDKLMEALRKGVSIEEVPTLLHAYEEERARARAPKNNPHCFEDKQAQKLSDLWFSLRNSATIKQKDQAGLAYISKILALGNETAERFAAGDRHADHEVGLKQSAVPVDKADFAGFWQEMRNVFPDVFCDEDISFLVNKGGFEAVFHFLWQLEIPLAEESSVLRRLHVNAHAYK